MSKKIATTVMFALLMFPWAAQAHDFGGWWNPWFGDHHRVSAPEMPNYFFVFMLFAYPFMLQSQPLRAMVSPLRPGTLLQRHVQQRLEKSF